MEIKFTDDNFEKEVLQVNSLCMVDFYADWCGPCKMMAPTIEELANEYNGKVKIGKLNVDENPGIASKYKVMSIPTILFIKDSKVVDTVVGAVPKSSLVEKINTYL